MKLNTLLKYSLILVLLAPVVASAAHVPARDPASMQEVYAVPSLPVATTAKVPSIQLKRTADEAGDLTLDSDGNFSLDIIYSDNVDTVSRLLTELHYDNSQLQLIEATASFTSPGAPLNPAQNPTTDMLSQANGNSDTDSIIQPGWGITSGSILNDESTKVLTVKFKPLGNATTTISFTSREYDYNTLAFASNPIEIFPPAGPGFSLDVDSAGGVNPNDALYLFRYASNPTAATAAGVAPGVSNAADILQNLQNGGVLLNVDGVGGVNPNDALYLFRFASNPTAATAAGVAPGVSNAADILQNLQNLE